MNTNSSVAAETLFNMLDGFFVAASQHINPVSIALNRDALVAAKEFYQDPTQPTDHLDDIIRNILRLAKPMCDNPTSDPEVVANTKAAIEYYIVASLSDARVLPIHAVLASIIKKRVRRRSARIAARANSTRSR